MKWSEKCMLEFTHRNLFEDDEHRARFKDLLDCYCSAPFFSKGLCKCMYLSAWDDAHFTVMLDVLNEMVLERDDHLGLMKDNGIVMEQQAEGGGDIGSAAIIEASVDFLNDIPYDRSRLHTLEIEDPDAAYIIKRGLLAAQCIDDLPPIDR
ncbi:MAG TPA: hypothetical protein DHV42_02730 [Lachnospiraceae bacterium]|nr:hypothetical protein [Lachnospiraceae bacterium]